MHWIFIYLFISVYSAILFSPTAHFCISDCHCPAGTTGLDGPVQPPWTPLTLTTAQDPKSVLWGHRPLPQWLHRRTGIQGYPAPHTPALPGHKPCWARPTHGPTSHPSLGLLLSPGRCLRLGWPLVPPTALQLPCSWPRRGVGPCWQGLSCLSPWGAPEGPSPQPREPPSWAAPWRSAWWD